MRTALLCISLLFAAAPLAAQPVTTNVDTEHSVLMYFGTSPVHDWEGVNHKVTGKLTLDFATPAHSQISISAPLESFDSGNGNRDNNMLDAVEVDSYPNVTFVSTEVTPVDAGKWNVKGNLTFHGKTRPVEVPVQIGASATLFEAKGSFTILLSDYKVNRPKLMMKPIDDQIKLEFMIRAPLGAAAAAR